MSTTTAILNIFIHVRKGPASPIMAGSVEEAITEAMKMGAFEPFKITRGRDEVILDEAQLAAEFAKRRGAG